MEGDHTAKQSPTEIAVQPNYIFYPLGHMGTVLAYVFGRRKHTVFFQLKVLFEPFALTRYERMAGVLTNGV